MRYGGNKQSNRFNIIKNKPHHSILHYQQPDELHELLQF